MLLQHFECDFLKSVADQVLDAARRVHEEHGPSQDKAACLEHLCHELELREIPCAKGIWQPEKYAGIDLNVGNVLDLVVDGSLIVMVAAQARVRHEDELQLGHLLCLSGHRAALLLNFGAPIFEQGIRRLGVEDEARQH